MNQITLRIQDLEPNRKYKRVGWSGQLGEQIYTVLQKVQLHPTNVQKLYRLYVGSESLLAATRYTEFVEVK